MEYSFENLCVPCYKELVAFITKRTNCKAQAEDIVQEAMTRAFSAWSRWEPQGDPAVHARAWLYRIVSNTFALQYQRNKAFQRITTVDGRSVHSELYQDEVTHHPYTEVDTIGDEVREALDRIRPEWAAVVRLVYIEGIPAHDVAKILKIAPGTVRSRMARGRLALARILSPFARQRFGVSVKEDVAEESLAGADETLATFEPTELPEPDADCIDSVVAEDDSLLFDFAQA